MRDCLHHIFPKVLLQIEDSKQVTLDEELLYIEEKFPSYPNVSIDSGLLDGNDEVYVMNCDFGWADLGMWHSIYESMKKSDDDNVVITDRIIIENSRDNIIKLPKDHLGIIHGLEGFIVAEQDNVLLICKKEDSSALVRKYISEAQIKYGDDFV
jgi:mannose-1-phosphate guanylyltransferase